MHKKTIVVKSNTMILAKEAWTLCTKKWDFCLNPDAKLPNESPTSQFFLW